MSRRTGNRDLKPCTFYDKPGGCWRGRDCRFSHSDPQGDAVASSTSNPQAHGWRTRTQTPSVPPGVCKFYWENNTCKREFGCRFQHTAGPSSSHSTPAPQQGNQSALDTIAPFLTDVGLAKINGAGTDNFFPYSTKPFSPNEAHRHLKRFLSDSFRFKTAFEACAFLKILNSACSTNSLWVGLFVQQLTVLTILFFTEPRRRTSM
jgi:hypothetical protein